MTHFQFKDHFFKLIILGLMLLSITTLSLQAQPAETPKTAAASETACYTIYLPIVLNDSAAKPAPSASAPQTANNEACEDAGEEVVEAFPDFNGDGFGDLAIGIPREDVTQGETYIQAGAVHVIYGTENGLVALAANAPVDDQLWSRQHEDLDDTAVDGWDLFGKALGLGDFNSDGFDDLAIGVPGSYVNGLDDAGVVQVLYGSANGLTTVGTQTWSQGHISIAGTPEEGDNFGATLASGDFNNDGHADLAIGVPRESVDGADAAGAVNILYGSANGLTGAGDEILTQNVEGLDASTAEEGDLFGHALEAGDFNGDGVDDLAVGSPYEDTIEATNGLGAEIGGAGSVQIFYGTTGTGLHYSLTGVNAQNIQADSPGIDNAMELGDNFGYSLAVGDLNGDGKDDLAIGSPYETHGANGSAIQDAGVVNIVFGSDSGLDTTTSPPNLSQAADGAAGIPVDYELFGYSLTIADFNNDGFDDLAASIPFEDVGGVVQIGAVQVFYSDENGPTTIGDDLIYDAIWPDDLDRFGQAVTAVDTNGDGFAELVALVGSDTPLESEIEEIGSVFVFFSDSDGVSQTNYQIWYQGYNGLAGNPEEGDFYSGTLP
ncbi:MAG: FG-GAP repeat protein [Chloroflexota bacterium]